MSKVYKRIRNVSPFDIPILIIGESGSGKELVARAIHNESTRRSGPFHAVNTGALTPELIASELFGHEKGAFTGATAAKKGFFEIADGGTLFLDEIGTMGADTQVNLLRIIESQT
ncbi:MAG: sigma-54 factor interaction domain-containing protein, partial [Spirochaetota bacterium]